MIEPYAIIAAIIDGENKIKEFTIPIVLNSEGTDYEIQGTQSRRVFVDGQALRIVTMEQKWTQKTNDLAALIRARQKSEREESMQRRRQAILERELRESARRMRRLGYGNI